MPRKKANDTIDNLPAGVKITLSNNPDIKPHLLTPVKPLVPTVPQDAEMNLQSELAALDKQYAALLQEARENYKRQRQVLLEKYK